MYKSHRVMMVLAAAAMLATTGAGAQAQERGRPGPPVGPLNIAAGHYLHESESCSEPGFEIFYYDGQRIALLREDEVFAEPVGRVHRERGTYWLEDWEQEVRRLSATRIQRTIQDTGEPERWCPVDEIPPGRRYRGQ